jgi:hypothetical protein
LSEADADIERTSRITTTRRKPGEPDRRNVPQFFDE